jgi:hypothetical protein
MLSRICFPLKSILRLVMPLGVSSLPGLMISFVRRLWPKRKWYDNNKIPCWNQYYFIQLNNYITRTLFFYFCKFLWNQTKDTGTHRMNFDGFQWLCLYLILRCVINIRISLFFATTKYFWYSCIPLKANYLFSHNYFWRIFWVYI